jgi:DNA-directed RNA polymerase subunit RPC12/RpoP
MPNNRLNDTFGDFKCIHCKQMISADIALSGVNNRNHCPYCLHSRHLDLYEAGDRLSACKGEMKPVALTLKRTRNKYGNNRGGELMIVHLCVECGKVSANRIAADDIADFVLEIYHHSLRMEKSTRTCFAEKGVEILTRADGDVVRARLYGRSARVLTPALS